MKKPTAQNRHFMFDSTLLDSFLFENALLHTHTHTHTVKHIHPHVGVFSSSHLQNDEKRVARKKNYLSPFNFFILIKCDPCRERVSVCFCWINANDFLFLSVSQYLSIFFFLSRTDVTHCVPFFTPFFCR